MTPRQYAFEIVFPTVREFLAANRDRRLAYLSCVATYHLVDHIAKADALEKWRVCDAMRLACGSDFDVVQGISEGKAEPDSIDMGPQSVCGPIGEIPTGAFGMGRFAVDRRNHPVPETATYVVHTCVVGVLQHFARLYPHHFNAPE